MTTDAQIVLRTSLSSSMEISGIVKFSDGSGYSSRLSIHSGRFACSDHPFYFDDLKTFADRLSRAYDKVEGKARLEHTYEKDFLEFSIEGDGHVNITGFLVQYGPPHQELRFGFECDQTYLPEVLRTLKQINRDLG